MFVRKPAVNFGRASESENKPFAIQKKIALRE